MRWSSCLAATLNLVGLMALCAALLVLLGAQCVVLLAVVPLSIFGLW